MTDADFHTLRAGACALLGATCNSQGQADELLVVDGIGIGVHHDRVSGGVWCYADLGPVHPHQRLSIYERLLVQNQVDWTSHRGRYGLEPATGHAVYTITLDKSETLQAQALADCIRHCAIQAARLQVDRPGSDRKGDAAM